jgi:hypothetical protein
MQNDLKKAEVECLNSCSRCHHIKHGNAECTTLVTKSDDSYKSWTEQCGCKFIGENQKLRNEGKPGLFS